MESSLHYSWQMDQHWQPVESNDIIRARTILAHLFNGFPGAFAVRLWDDSVVYLGDTSPAFTFHLKRPAALLELVLFGSPTRLTEAYFSNRIGIEGDFGAAMQLHEYFATLSLPIHEKLDLVFRALTLADADSSTSSEDSGRGMGLFPNHDNISTPEPDNGSDAFYRDWLDECLSPTCAHFEHPAQELNAAQHNRLDLVCRKLRLQHGECLLDIGCGWGTLAFHAATHYGVSVHGITDNPQQYAYATEQVKKLGLEKQITIELRHYTDLPDVPCYDKVVSIDLLQVIGKAHLAECYAKVNTVLKPGGLFLSHGVVSEEPAWQHGAITNLVNQHLFPEGEIRQPDLEKLMESAQFELCQVEGLHRHYALTLRQWVHNLETYHARIARLVGEETYRVWRLHLTGAAIQFEQGVAGLYQILAVRKQAAHAPVPFVRKGSHD